MGARRVSLAQGSRDVQGPSLQPGTSRQGSERSLAARRTTSALCSPRFIGNVT